jgi:endonuclease YncB( thermonuclease family)
MNRPFAIAAALCIASSAALAQDEAPAPPAVPIGEVTEEPISPAAGQTIEGMATVIDGDELRVGDSVIRLFGIAAPAISSNLGPDARLYLDGLAGGRHIVCTEVDRNIEEQSIAICTIEGTDLATELLAQGLAAVYRVGAPPTPEERELAARYDTEEADARERKLGIWAPRDAAPAAAPAAAPPPTLLESAIPKWIELAPLLGLIALLGIIGLIQLARRREPSNEVEGIDDQVLTATLLAEVSAIRDVAQEQYDGTASFIQDLPIPGSHHGLLSLPAATVFTANADRLDVLPVSLATRLVRFHAMREGAAHLIGQSHHVRCDVVRATLQSLVQGADEVLAAR